jgi:hypothetical protein
MQTAVKYVDDIRILPPFIPGAHNAILAARTADNGALTSVDSLSNTKLCKPLSRQVRAEEQERKSQDDERSFHQQQQPPPQAGSAGN